jgi:hypothetical protein
MQPSDTDGGDRVLTAHEQDLACRSGCRAGANGERSATHFSKLADCVQIQTVQILTLTVYGATPPPSAPASSNRGQGHEQARNQGRDQGKMQGILWYEILRLLLFALTRSRSRKHA